MTRETWNIIKIAMFWREIAHCLFYANPDPDPVDQLNEIAGYIWWCMIKFRSRPEDREKWNSQ